MILLTVALVHISTYVLAQTNSGAPKGNPETATPKDSSSSKADIDALIEISDYKDISKGFVVAVNYYISKKTKAPNCSKDSACVGYWKKIEENLLKNKDEVQLSIKNKVSDLLSKRYSTAQIKWLLQVYKTPLLNDFINFYKSENSPLPFGEGRRLLDSKTKDIKPYTATPVSGTTM
jgi:hypothetical protein